MLALRSSEVDPTQTVVQLHCPRLLFPIAMPWFRSTPPTVNLFLFEPNIRHAMFSFVSDPEQKQIARGGTKSPGELSEHDNFT